MVKVSERKLEGWSENQETIQINSLESHLNAAGNQCILIPKTKNAVWEWIYFLMQHIEEGPCFEMEEPYPLPGVLVKIRNNDDGEDELVG